MKDKTVVFTGGGTGGHVYPALPLIRKFQDKGFRIVWIGSRRGLERDIVSDWDIEYRAISTGKLRRYFSFRNFTDIFRIAAGFFQSLALLHSLRPQLVFSKGGFVSVPPVAAGACLRIPSYTHDSDLVPGLATRINKRFASGTFVAYEESRKYLGGGRKVVVSGNPVRDDFFTPNPLPEPWAGRVGDRSLLLVLGGSSGALQVNSLIHEILPFLCEHFTVIHQMGGELYERQRESLPKHRHYWPVPYLKEELPSLLQRADLAVARAGAGTLWELAVTGTPSILIPLRSGSRGDQVGNALLLKNRGMALVMEEDKPSAEDLKALISGLVDRPDELKEMRGVCLNFVNNRAEDVMMSYLMEDC